MSRNPVTQIPKSRITVLGFVALLGLAGTSACPGRAAVQDDTQARDIATGAGTGTGTVEAEAADRAEPASSRRVFDPTPGVLPAALAAVAPPSLASVPALDVPLIEAAPINLDVVAADVGSESAAGGSHRADAPRSAREASSEVANLEIGGPEIARPETAQTDPVGSIAGQSRQAVASLASPTTEAGRTLPSPDGAGHGSEIAGPDLPDAALAERIMRRFLVRRGSADGAIAEIYAGRANRPLWIVDGALKRSLLGVRAVLDGAADHGLRPDSYRTVIALDGLDAQADTDIALTRAMVRYARDARGARLVPRRISVLITAEPTVPEPLEIVATLQDAEDAGRALEGFQPQQPGYRSLQKALVDLRRRAGDSAVPETRAGAVTQSEIVANMERWRWMPRSLGGTYILVNVPGYELQVVRDGVVIHRTKVIVGKPQTPTPIFSKAMEYLIVNPYWNIPPSIALKEMLPQLRANPYALQRKGFEIVRGGRTVDPAGIDWTGSIGNIRIRQPPGERNALGLIKFMFPNDHSVYLHDTPTRGLFSQSARAFSHGCVRVFEPFALADILLAHQNGLDERQLRAMVGKGGERTIHLQTRVPVHIAYFTAVVDGDGALQRHADIYGHDAKVRAALQLAN